MVPRRRPSERRKRTGAALAGATLAGALLLGAAGPSGAAPLPAIEAVAAALEGLGGADLVIFDEPRPKVAPRLLLATRARAPVEAVRALLREPAAYRRAVPAFVRADVVGRRPGASGGATDLLVAWELEVPLWNLEGRLWLRPRADGVDLDLSEGDFAPGLFRITAVPAGEETLLLIDARANVREANWLTRRLVARSALAEPAMTAAAALVLLRALALEPLRAGATPAPARRPTAAPGPPADGQIDLAPLAGVSASLDARLAVAAVRSRPDGRLARVELALSMPIAPASLARKLGAPETWRALPGWRKVTAQARSAAAAAPGRAAAPSAPSAPMRWEVDSRLPFVDFDATWEVRPGPPFRAVTIAGETRGAVLGWDLAPGAAGRGSSAIFSLHPRIERAGYLPRKFVEAEPLLELGLSLGLAYVDALSLARTVGQGAQ